MKTCRYPNIKIHKLKNLIKINPDGNHHHEAHVYGYKIKFADDISITVSLDDLKSLRKIVRKAIRDENNQSV